MYNSIPIIYFSKSWISVFNIQCRGRSVGNINSDLFAYAGNNPVRYTDPDGKWFFLDDMLFSLFAKLFCEQDVSWWQGTLDSFLHSWKHPIEHGKAWYNLYNLFFEWTDSAFGLESYKKWHTHPSKDSEFGFEIDFGEKEVTIFFKKKKRRNTQLPELDLSKLQEKNKNEKTSN